MTLAKRIRDSRYAKGWGPDDLAGRAKISRTALYQIESGKTETPRAGTLRRIARALGVSTDALLGNEPLQVPSYPDEGIELPGNMPEPVVSAVNPTTVDEASASRQSRRSDVERKFHVLLDSHLGEGIVRIVEESYRLLPQRV